MNIKSLIPCVAMLLAIAGACSPNVNSTFCDTETECDSSTETSFCNIADNTCISPPSVNSCNSVEPCGSAALPHCSDETAGVCVACLSSQDCSGTELCDLTTNTCQAFACSAGDAGDALCAENFPELAYCGDTEECVECRESAHCTDSDAVVCQDFSCVACVADSQCGEDFCETGSCVADLRFVYVASNGSPDLPCGREDAPCSSVEVAMNLVTPERNEIRIAAGNYEGTTTITDQDLILRAMGVVTFRYFSVANTSPLLSVVGTSQVEVYGINYLRPQKKTFDGTVIVSCSGTSSLLLDTVAITGGGTGVLSACDLEIVDSSFANQVESGVESTGTTEIRTSTLLGNGLDDASFIGVDCNSGSLNISASTISNYLTGIDSRCDTVLRSSTISNNLRAGVKINNSNFDIVNNFIVQNGESNDISSRGVNISNSGFKTTGSQRFDFNTVAGNKGSNSPVNMLCQANFASPIEALGNIVWDAVPIGSNVSLANCSFVSSSVEGVTNFEPEFVNPVAGVAGDYRLSANSQCIDQVNTTTLDVDFEGDMRPLGIRHDMGADEAQ